MPIRRSRTSVQPTSRQVGSVVLSMAALVLMIICLVLVIVLWATQNFAPASPKSEAIGREHLPDLMERLVSSHNYQASAKLNQVTHAMKMAPERDLLMSRESVSVNLPENSLCPYEDQKAEEAKCTVSGSVCNCTSQRLTQVPTSLAEHIQCTTLLLGDNCLRHLPSYAFAEFTELEILDLRDNQISMLNISSFQGLPKLQSLYLQGNDLPMDGSTFVSGIFQNLISLISLDISGNNKVLIGDNLRYPGEALSDLTNLQNLTMDGLYKKDFPEEFESLASLQTLKLGSPLGGYCQLDTITYDTFKYLTQIKTLNISYCQLVLVLAFNFEIYGLDNLETLDVSWNQELSVDTVFALMMSLPDTSNFQYLYANHVTLPYAPSTTITKKYAEMLPEGLRYVEARGNGLESVEEGVLESLPEYLTYLDLSDNRFLFGAYLAKMSLMANLETLLLNGANTVYNFPTSYPSSMPMGALASVSASLPESGNTSDKLIFQLPPRLKRLSMIKSGLSYRLTNISVNSSNSLEELNLDHNVFSELKGPLTGLYKLTKLSMAGCSIESIGETFFQNLTSLERLDLSDNLIGWYLLDHGNISIFKDLIHLKYLDLSSNSLRSRSFDGFPDFLKGLGNLEELYMQINLLTNFNIDISNLNKLRVLNLSINFVYTLNSDVREFIDSLVTKSNTSIQVDLSRNTIECDCTNLDFLNWLSRTKAVHDSLFTSRYVCVSPDVTAVFLVKDGYVSAIDKLTRECTSKYALFLFSLVGTLLLVSFVIVLILYRFRWNLRYMYYAAYLSIKKRGQPVVIEDNFPYDVFVSYAWPDEHFIVDTLCPALEARGLKLHVHGRDFLVGDYIASNIVTAVKESRKTLVVLTRALLESTWCNYEIQMANMESVHTGRPVLVFLIKESLSNRQLGQNLLSHIRNNTYIPYPEAGPAQEPGNHLLEAFWDKLAADLKS